MTTVDTVQQSLVVRPAAFSDHTRTVDVTSRRQNVTPSRQLSSSDLDALVPDHQVIKLYYSLLSPQRKKAIDLQDKLRSASTESLYPTALRVSTKSKKTRPKTPFYEVRESPINKGSATPAVKYVYLSQNRPKPIDPLKAWKGYNGNLYFEPMQIRRFSSLNDVGAREGMKSGLTTSQSSRKSHTMTAASTRPKRPMKMNWAEASQQPALMLEREAVLTRLTMATPATDDYSLRDETVGSLRISNDSPARDGSIDSKHGGSKSAHKKPQICRGSMVQQLRVRAKGDWRTPKLSSSYYDYAISLSRGKATTTPQTTSIDSINTIGYQSTTSLPVTRRVKMPALISANDMSAVVSRERSDCDSLEVDSQASQSDKV